MMMIVYSLTKRRFEGTIYYESARVMGGRVSTSGALGHVLLMAGGSSPDGRPDLGYANTAEEKVENTAEEKVEASGVHRKTAEREVVEKADCGGCLACWDFFCQKTFCFALPRFTRFIAEPGKLGSEEKKKKNKLSDGRFRSYDLEVMGLAR